MTHPIDLTGAGLVALGRASVTALRAALERDAGPAAAGYLQEAGYAGGDAVFEAFQLWVADRGMPPAEDASIEDFARNAADFFHDLGWGSISLGTLGGTVATLDSADWAEADEGGHSGPTCHLSTGMFANFFGRVADAPLAVMEVECRSGGSERCRFLLGSAEVMQRLYEEMADGSPYDEAYVLSASA
jgi:predicted hydrocarbon binding protein